MTDRWSAECGTFRTTDRQEDADLAHLIRVFPLIRGSEAVGLIGQLFIKSPIIVSSCKAINSLKKDFDDWFKLAAESKAARNQYIHGLWNVYPQGKKPIQFTPVDWVGSHGKDITVEMTLDEFFNKMGKIEFVFNSFMSLREKHGI